MYPPCSAEPLPSPLISSQEKQSEGDRVEAGLGAENLQSLFRSPTRFRLIHWVPHKVSFEERVQQLKKKKRLMNHSMSSFHKFTKALWLKYGTEIQLETPRKGLCLLLLGSLIQNKIFSQLKNLPTKRVKQENSFIIE